MSRLEKINEQIENAKRVIRTHDKECVIVSMKKTKKAKKEIFGFRFHEAGKSKIGDCFQCEDGTYMKVEAII